MNLWLRLVWILIKCFFRGARTTPDHIVHTHFRVGWLDCDLNHHLTNSRYASFMDLARLSFFSDTGLWASLKKRSAFPILQSIEISFIKPIYPGSRVTIATSIIGYDDKYCYINQTFLLNNQIATTARVRAILVDHKNNIHSPKEVLGLYFDENKLPDSVLRWKEYLLAKIKETS
ncbi:MAG: thioesterase [Gammaproteobacteria bacterium]|nr:thioesterase [Gammaproteobacteria bacterium]